MDMNKQELLQEGDVFRLEPGDTVYALVPQHFLASNTRGDWTVRRGKVTVGGEFDYLVGEYLVTKTAMTGGGTGHGPHDVFPDGHQVTAVKLPTKGAPSYVKQVPHEVSFAQTGCFDTTTKMAGKTAIRKGRLQWVDSE